MKFKIIIGLIIVVSIGSVFLLKGSNNSSSTPASSTNTTPQGDYNNLLNKPAPGFNLASYDGRTVSLEKLRGKKVVLFFNEGLICYPACWNQIAALGQDKRLNNDDVITLSIVVNSQAEWQTAVRKMPQLGIETLLLDTDASISKQYGMLTVPSSMHTGRLPGHTYVIVDKKGVIRYTLDDPQMAVRNDNIVKEINKI